MKSLLSRLLALLGEEEKPAFVRTKPLTGKLEMNHYTGAKPMWYWKDFSPKELASKGNGSVLIEYEALNKLQDLRTKWGKPLHVNSAYRDPVYNARVGGATHSMHMEGKAFDISVVGWTKVERNEFKELAYKIGFRGFGGYGTFIHMDIGRERKWGQTWAWPKELV